MAKDILQVGDSGPGICYHPSHDPQVAVTGTIVEGYSGADVDGILIAKQSAVVQLSCGHTGTLVCSETKVTVDDIVGVDGDAWTTGSAVTTGNITNTKGGVTAG